MASRRPVRRKRAFLDAGAVRALRAVAPFLDALAAAPAQAPAAAARSLRAAVAATFGWRCTLARGAPGAPLGQPMRLGEAEAVIPVAPGAGAMRLRGGPPQALARVATLCAQALAQARAHPVEGTTRAAPSRPRVLVADRDAAARLEVARLLDPDHEVITADDEAAAVELARAGRVDAVVLGTALPGPPGLAALAALRQERPGAELPALVLAGRADEALRVRALELGADFMPKPVSGAELRARLARVLRQASSARALRYEAHTDPLTRLPNRRALEERLGEEVTRAERYRTGLACIMADLDGLKPINDALGHAAGDRALQALAAVLRTELRESDFVARVGGDEFLLLLPHTGAEEALVLAERVRRRLEQVPFEPGMVLRASFGVAAMGPGQGGEALVQAADRALYAAKRAGRATVRLAGVPARRRA